MLYQLTIWGPTMDMVLLYSISLAVPAQPILHTLHQFMYYQYYSVLWYHAL